MARCLFALSAILAAAQALAFEVRPGLYETSGNTTYDDFIEGQTLPQPPRSPSIAASAKVCIPDDSARWLADRLHGQFEQRYPAAKVERDARHAVAGRPQAQVYRLMAPLSLPNKERLLNYTASVVPDKTAGAKPQDFVLQFTYEIQRGRYLERSHSNWFYRHIGADCGETAPAAD